MNPIETYNLIISLLTSSAIVGGFIGFLIAFFGRK